MNIAAIEAFARGAMSALLAGPDLQPRRTRRRRPHTPTTPPRPARPDAQMTLGLDAIDAPGTSADLPAPPITQAQMEAMERVLRGEQPAGYYKPGEGVAPWMES